MTGKVGNCSAAGRSAPRPRISLSPGLSSRNGGTPVLAARTVSVQDRLALIQGRSWGFRLYNRSMKETKKLPYVWDYEIDQMQFQEILTGRRVIGRLDQDWAVRRLLEYAPYEEIIHLIGYKQLVENWPRWRGRIRSKSRVRGFDFLVKWLPEKHPELLRG